MRIIIGILIICSLLPYASYAQQQATVEGEVILIDDKEEIQLPYAGISVLQLPDSIFIKKATCNEKGSFHITFPYDTNIPYLLKASYTGCTDKYVPLNKLSDSTNVHKITLSYESLLLDEVTVSANAPMIIQRKDTVIYNATAIKTPEGAFLEALLRRVPGLQYDAQSHSIKYNGYTINEILLNGKDFFKGNIIVPLENLPATLIKNIKVYDKQTEEEEDTQMNSAEKNYVIDLQTKEEINNSFMGSVEGGYGNYKRRDINGRIMKFEENGNHFMITGQSTNRYQNSSYEKNISNNAGITVSHAFSDDFNVSGNINYNQNRNGSTQSFNNEQYLISGNQYNVSENNFLNNSKGINGDISLRWKKEKNSLYFSTNINNTNSDGTSESRDAAFDVDPNLSVINPFHKFDQTPVSTRINNNHSQSTTNQQSLSYNIYTSFTHKLNDKGHNLNLQFSTRQSNSENNNFLLSSTHYYRLHDQQGNDSILYRNQYILIPPKNNYYHIGLAYTHILSEKSKLQLAYGIDLQKEKYEQNTYDLTSFNTENHITTSLPNNYKEGIIDSLTNKSHSRSILHNIEMQYNFNKDNWFFQTSLQIKPNKREIDRQTGEHMADTTAYSVEWQPSINLSYQNDKLFFNLMYYGNTSQPSLTDLIAPTDYSSPLSIRHSNPNLRPTYNQNINAMFNINKIGLSGFFYWGQSINSITSAVIYNKETGGQEIFPININGNWNMNGSLSFDKSIKLFRFYINGNENFNRFVSFINSQEDRSLQKSSTNSASTYLQARISYLPSWGNIEINGSWNYTQSINSLQERNTFNQNYSTGLNAFVNLPLHFVFNTDLNCHFRHGTGISDENKRDFTWNMKLSWKFLKQKQAELSALWADILNQRQNYFSNASSYGFMESYQDLIKSYFLISFKYQWTKTK